MTPLERVMAGREMPANITLLVAAMAEQRARGLECAADHVALHGHDDLAEELRRQAARARAEAVNRPPLVTVV